jgi:hypothetical protein
VLSALIPFFRLLSFRFPDSGERGFLSRGWSKRISTMIHKAMKGVNPRAGNLDQRNLFARQTPRPRRLPRASSGRITELPNPDGRLSRVHLLLFGNEVIGATSKA